MFVLKGSPKNVSNQKLKILYFVLGSGPIRQKNYIMTQLDYPVTQKNHQLLKPPNVWCEICI